MTQYRNLTVDLPARIRELDLRFRRIADDIGLEVSYLLMKLGAAFLLPYERTVGTSGTSKSTQTSRQQLRKDLQLDRKFHESVYCQSLESWFQFDVTDFSQDPRTWDGKGTRLTMTAAEVLCALRNAVAHSNLQFDGIKEIERVYFGSLLYRRHPEKGYRVIRCEIKNLEKLLDAWLDLLAKIKGNPPVIWRELEQAA